MTFSFKITLLVAGLLLCCYLKSPAQTQPQKNEFINDSTLNFDNLLAKFKGHIVYVDFWASWCAPCRQELERKKDIRLFADFAQKNNIVILYISGDGVEKNWTDYLAKNPLSGYHIITNAHLMHDALTTFAVPKSIHHPEAGTSFFIPRHMIVDTHGKMIDSNTGSQGSAKVYVQLKQLLKAD